MDEWVFVVRPNKLCTHPRRSRGLDDRAGTYMDEGLSLLTGRKDTGDWATEPPLALVGQVFNFALAGGVVMKHGPKMQTPSPYGDGYTQRIKEDLRAQN